MRKKFIDILECPSADCRNRLIIASAEDVYEDDIISGVLECVGCLKRYPIERRIPRFTDRTKYDDSWDWQWKRFHHLRGESRDGTTMISDTILRRAQWTPEHLQGKTIVEFGCGCGTDSEVLATMAGTLISIELSDAVDVVPEEFVEQSHVLLLQADIMHVPLRRDIADIGFCHRVIQHTPSPELALKSMTKYIRPEGEFFLHSYDRHIKSLLHFRYLYRPITKRLKPQHLYCFLCIVGPVFYPLVGILRRVAILRKPVRLFIPFVNHARSLKKEGIKLNAKELYDWHLMVTFDALSPQHDHPSSAAQITRWFRECGYDQVEVLKRNSLQVKAWRSKASA